MGLWPVKAGRGRRGGVGGGGGRWTKWGWGGKRLPRSGDFWENGRGAGGGRGEISVGGGFFKKKKRGTPNPSMPPTVRGTVGPYHWTRNPIPLADAAALLRLSLLLVCEAEATILLLLAYSMQLA